MAGVKAGKEANAAAANIPSFAFIGEMASGKSTFADSLRVIMERELGVNVYRLSTSAKIIGIATELFGMKEKDRVLLGLIASKMREIDPDVWVNYMVRDIKANGRTPFIVDGFRFVEDKDIFKKNFPSMLTIRIEADPQQRLDAYKATYGHYPTEEEIKNKGEGDAGLIPFDLKLFNNYTDENRIRELNRIVEAIKSNAISELLRP